MAIFLIKDKLDFHKCVLADLRVRGLDKLPFCYRVRKPLIYFTLCLRKTELHKNKTNGGMRGVWGSLRALHLKRLGMRMGLTVPVNTCGPGLFIVHWGSVVVSGKAKIGSNCRIHSCVNIGEYGGEAPIIGDNVYIGPGVKIYGSIRIGDNVVIGANAVVNKSFPDNVTIAGVPAKIIKYGLSDDRPAD